MASRAHFRSNRTAFVTYLLFLIAGVFVVLFGLFRWQQSRQYRSACNIQAVAVLEDVSVTHQTKRRYRHRYSYWLSMGKAVYYVDETAPYAIYV